MNATAEKTPVDLLNREEIIGKLENLLMVISENRSSCTFALNGQWGSGKTFVLERLQERLWKQRNEQGEARFLVFHYNCWQYDYYEEPLIAIVAAMLDCIEEQPGELSEEDRKNMKAAWGFAKPFVATMAKEFVKNKIGVDLTGLHEDWKTAAENLDKANEGFADDHEYDKYYSFTRVVRQAREKLTEMSKTKTIVVIVDELDRCLPEYAIKVLERLHHLFDGVANSAVILGVDKGQLEHTVQEIFGGNTDTTKYLKKFVDFEIQLDIGKIAGGFISKYSEYFGQFDNIYNSEPTVYLDEFICDLFAGMDVRTQEQVMGKLKMIHSLSALIGVKKDDALLYFELLWGVFREYGLLEWGVMLESDSTKISYRHHYLCFNSKWIEYALKKQPLFERILAFLQESWTYIGLDDEGRSNVILCRMPSQWLTSHRLLWYLYVSNPEIFSGVRLLPPRHVEKDVDCITRQIQWFTELGNCIS